MSQKTINVVTVLAVVFSVGVSFAGDCGSVYEPVRSVRVVQSNELRPIEMECSSCDSCRPQVVRVVKEYVPVYPQPTRVVCSERKSHCFNPFGLVTGTLGVATAAPGVVLKGAGMVVEGVGDGFLSVGSGLLDWTCDNTFVTHRTRSCCVGY